MIRGGIHGRRQHARRAAGGTEPAGRGAAVSGREPDWKILDAGTGGAWFTVAGVADDAKNGGLTSDEEPEIYYLRGDVASDWRDRRAVLVIRSALPEATVAGLLQAAVHNLDPTVPVGHALRCGPETSVTSPLRWRWFELRGARKRMCSRRGRGNVGIPKGFPKSVGRVGSRLHGFPCFPHSVISMGRFRAANAGQTDMPPSSAMCRTRYA